MKVGQIALWCGGIAFAIAAMGMTVARATNTLNLTFVTHASFFSGETHQPKPLDPQVFVRDSSAPAAVGPQNIKHIAGIRPAFIEEDSKSSALFNARGDALGFELGEWLGAKGDATITAAANGTTQVALEFTHLLPGGHYSLFENHFDQQPVGFTPLDGAGNANGFIANKDGSARITVSAPQALTHANAVLLVFHSDKTSHGDQRGDIGVDAHHQLITRIP